MMVDKLTPHDDATCRHGLATAGHSGGRCADRQEAEHLQRESARLRGEIAREQARTARAERKAARLERQIQRVFARTVHERQLWRLAPAALAAELDGIRASFVANGMAPERALTWCAELEALARGQAAAVQAGGGRR